MKDRLAIIGASYLQKPLVLKARELGYETHVFAWSEGAVCERIAHSFYPVSIRDIDTITKICREIEPCGIVTIASDLASITVNEVAARLGLIGNSSACSQATTNKFLMREKLSESDLPCPRYARIDDLSFHLPREFRYPLIVKPVDRSGSRGVSMVKNADELPAAIELALNESFRKEAVAEEFIEGSELSVEAISWQGKHYILQYTDKITTGPPHFVEKTHHQPAVLDLSQQARIAKIVNESLTSLGVSMEHLILR